MKKVLIILSALIIMIVVNAAPSLSVSSGMFRILTAMDHAGRLSLTGHATAFLKDFNVTYYLPDGTPAQATDTYVGGDINFGAAYTFTRWLELSIKGIYKVDAATMDNEASQRVTTSDNYASYGIGDTEVGMKLMANRFFNSTEYADMGVYVYYRLDTGDQPSLITEQTTFASMDHLYNKGGLFRFFTGNSRDYGATFILSFTVPTQVPMDFNINAGYEKRNILADDNMVNSMHYGANFALHLGSFVPFVEFYGKKFMGDAMFEGKYLNYITGGFRFDTPVGLVFDIGADYRVTAFTSMLRPDTLFDSTGTLISNTYETVGWGAAPDWRVHLGLSYYYDFIKDVKKVKVEEKKTIITGKVVDSATGKPLSAIVTLPGYSEDIQVITDSTGTYIIEVNPGTIRIRVDREGYKWQEKGIILEKGQTKILDFVLNEKKQEKGTLTGKIVDKSTGEPVSATLSFPGTEMPEINVDPATGVYRIDMIPGTYTMASVADGYVNFAQPVVIEKDKTLVFNIDMLKKGGKIELKGIYFDSGKATIRPESYYVLDEATKMLKQNPNVKIEVQGHTDSVGGANSNLMLSQARAESVRNYLIMNGIESWRIIAKGYGESMPIADNGTNDGRARNRRIEFLIIGE